MQTVASLDRYRNGRHDGSFSDWTRPLTTARTFQTCCVAEVSGGTGCEQVPWPLAQPASWGLTMRSNAFGPVPERSRITR